MQKDERIDEYIAKAQPFAQPVLKYLRELVHKACPDAEETMKWSFPHFDYKGKMMCSMAAFKQHAVFGFWKANLLKDPHNYLSENADKAMGNLGRITSIDDLPPEEVLIDFIHQAMKLNDEGVKLPSTGKKSKMELLIPEDFANELQKNPKVWETFNNFSYSHKKEYVEWITEAKTETTRNKRIATAIDWISQGKPRNWKYLK